MLLLEPSAPDSLHTIKDYFTAHMDFHHALNRAFCAFQRAVLGSAPFIFTL
jgi:hypothetical protein